MRVAQTRLWGPALALALVCGCSDDDDKNPTPTSDGKVVMEASTASDGSAGTKEASTGTDTVTVTSPAAGADWKVGSKQAIKWETTVNDVKIEYSTDGGTTWNTIEDTLDDSMATWKNYEWTVPDKPTTNGVMRISDYNDSSINGTANFKISK